AGTLVYQVNQLHFNGETLNGSTGKTFFVPNAGDNYTTNTPAASFSGAAGTIALSPDVDGNPQNIAAASTSGGSGNNENALAILGLQDLDMNIRKWAFVRGSVPSSQPQSLTMGEDYTNFVGDMALLAEQTNQGQEFETSLINQLNNTRDAISGVNLDEEMVNLIKYQQAYVAASKALTIADQLMNDLLAIR
ncbi:MAG TPA: flagellar basal body rod C-terminal domain-containing protein, partial [Syntrophales bacterium]|nr:flagellar basal body rod C-terminal domain-containing protein [Syntrophales bacterium]